jgi:hypothetical protein
MEQFSFNFDALMPVSSAAGYLATSELAEDQAPTQPAAPPPATKSRRKAATKAVPQQAKKLTASAMAATPAISVLPPSLTLPVAIPAPTWTGELPSFAEALDFIDAAPDLTSTKRRDLRSALISAAKLLGQQPRDLKLDLKPLSDTLLTQPPKLIEKQVKRRRNVLFGTKARAMAIIF